MENLTCTGGAIGSSSP